MNKTMVLPVGLLFSRIVNSSVNGTSGGAGLPSSPSSVDLSETASLPLVIREKDVEYQVK